MVAGGLGVGKTTFLDAFANHLLGVEFDDCMRYRLVDERSVDAERNEELVAKQGDSGTNGDIH